MQQPVVGSATPSAAASSLYSTLFGSLFGSLDSLVYHLEQLQVLLERYSQM
jgi:hypothetical protein